jgi:hypothetical protein
LGGCGTSVPVRYYTLTPPSAPVASGAARMLVEVLPVAMPERLNRPELVLNGPEGRLEVRQSDRWVAPLADEIAQVVDEALWRKLAAADSYRAPTASSTLPQYRLSLHVERFDADPDLAATVDASWTIRRLPQGLSATCRARVKAALASFSPQGAAGGLALASADLAGLIADSLAHLDGGWTQVCPGGVVTLSGDIPTLSRPTEKQS